MDGRKRRANYMKQGGLKMYAPWVIWLIAFVKMIYLYAQIGQKGITFMQQHFLQFYLYMC